ncbi:MFS transporter [Rhizorhabdus argentea]|uniref:MFS transporter n=1 Tax=Rhizorhabdus argentea TaxID=1387174 RepID=UPI0030EDE038
MLLPVILSGTAMMALVFVALAPVLALLARHLGGGQQGAFYAQMLMSTPALGIVIGGPLAGALIGRWGPPAVLLGALLGYALFGGFGLFSEDAKLLIGSRFLLGADVAAIVTATSTMIGRLYDSDARNRLFGLQGAIGAGVALIGVWSAGAVGEGFGWRAPFALYLLALPMALLAFIAVRGINFAAGHRVEVEADTFASLSLYRLWPTYLLIFAMCIVMQMTGIQTGLVMAEDGVTSPASQSVVLGMASLTGMLAGLAYGRVCRRFSRHVVGNLILLFWCAGQISIGLSHEPVATGAAVALSGVGSGLMMSYLPTLLLGQVPLQMQAKALGFYYATMFLGDFCNPLVMSGLRTVLPDYHAVFIAIGGICGACICPSLVATQMHGRRAQW